VRRGNLDCFVGALWPPRNDIIGGCAKVSMMQRDYILILHDTLKDMDESRYWLKRSYDICQAIGVKDAYNEDEFDAFETLTGRFARTCDIIIQKGFRSIDKVEFEDRGALLDALNRAHKRGLIDSIDEIRIVRDLRNEIVHEYRRLHLQKLFQSILAQTPGLFSLLDRISDYCRQYADAGHDVA